MITPEQLSEAFAWSFMKPEICAGLYFRIITNHGAEIVPSDVIGRTCSTAAESLANYVTGDISDPDELIECKDGFYARMSAPGHMDCTDWCEYPSEQAAAQDLVNNYAE